MEWISVKDYLPGINSKKILGFFQCGTGTKSKFTDCFLVTEVNPAKTYRPQSNRYDYDLQITHWMYIDEPK